MRQSRASVEASATWLVSLGVTRLRTMTTQCVDHYAVVMLDLEEDEFDVSQGILGSQPFAKT
ncbi:hypothetical protein BA895_17920 [Humibacillus sp. DSM 29435]|nr:hypothetical protein BA895_17920 [Humibacillus sp. DSM 29435]